MADVVNCDYIIDGDFVDWDYKVGVLVSRWLGPVSVTVYAPGDDFKTALDIIFHIR